MSGIFCEVGNKEILLLFVLWVFYCLIILVYFFGIYFCVYEILIEKRSRGSKKEINSVWLNVD